MSTAVVNRKEALPEFDLHVVRLALLTNHRLYNGTPMSSEEIDEAIEEYRSFLLDHKMAGMPEPFVFPGRRIDRVWHTHMCETEQYYNDCMSYFGKMFHHRSAMCDNGVGDAPAFSPIKGMVAMDK